jgi:large subunit ribosomal protein L5
MAFTLRSAIASSSRSSQIALPCARPILLPPTTHSTRLASSIHTPLEEFTIPDIKLGPTHLPRYMEHYDNSLAPDLMYMTYTHGLTKPLPQLTAPKKPLTPYEINRPPPVRSLKPGPRFISPDLIPELKSITLHSFVKEAVASKHNLLPTIMTLRAITGESINGGGRGSTGVQIIRAKQGVARWKTRVGMPLAVQIELEGQVMYDFLQSLVDFVLPRVRDFPGYPLNPIRNNAAPGWSGVVGLTLPKDAVGYFPQIEANIDSYPRLNQIEMFFKTNLKGPRAKEMTRTLLTGFKIPFYRP